MLLRYTSLPFAALFTVAIGSLGCDKSESPAAQAAEQKASSEDQVDQAIQARKAERLAAQKAKDEEAAQKKQQLEALAALPEKMPKKLDDACKEVGKSHDAFMRRHFADNPETLQKWTAASGTQLPLTIAQCKKHGSIEVAACQAKVLEEAPAEFKKELPGLLRACIDKFGGTADPDQPT
jgi:hypothetical protein